MDNILYLTKKDMQCAGVNDMNKCLSVMKETMILLKNNDYRMGGESSNSHGISVTFPEKTNIPNMPINKPDYRFTAMPAYLGGRFHIVGIKTYGSNIDNKLKCLPRSILMLSLLDVNSGIPLAYMSANELSAVRTGAMAGLGVELIPNKDIKTVGVVGPGNIAIHSIQAIIETHQNVQSIQIKGRSTKSTEHFIKYCQTYFPTIKNFNVVDSIQEACNNADLVLFSATRANKIEETVRFKYDWLKKGCLVIAVSPVFVDEKLYKNNDVKFYVDNYKMYESAGKGKVFPTQVNVWNSLGMGFYDATLKGFLKPEEIIDIGDLILNPTKIDHNKNTISIYVVGGMAIEDVAWGFECYKNALNKGLGTKLPL